MGSVRHICAQKALAVGQCGAGSPALTKKLSSFTSVCGNMLFAL